MNVIIMSRSTFAVTQLANVTSITFSNNSYNITVGGTTTAYSADNYRVTILW